VNSATVFESRNAPRTDVELFVFVCAAAMCLVGAIGVVVRRNPVHAALSLVLTLFGVAVLFVMLQAEFLAAVQVIVYGGAIVVLFLFVIMLLGVDRSEDLKTEPIVGQRWIATFVSGGLAVLLAAAVVGSRGVVGPSGTGLASPTLEDPDLGIRQLATSLLTDHVFAFELTSILLVVAVAGTVVMARRPRRSVGDDA
jgi:NADH-quinone oxidoreductase subunit J